MGHYITVYYYFKRKMFIHLSWNTIIYKCILSNDKNNFQDNFDIHIYKYIQNSIYV